MPVSPAVGPAVFALAQRLGWAAPTPKGQPLQAMLAAIQGWLTSSLHLIGRNVNRSQEGVNVVMWVTIVTE